MQLAPCTSAEAGDILAELEKSGCALLYDWAEVSQTGCADAEVVCSEEAAIGLLEHKIATVVSTDAGAHWRNSSGSTQSFAEGFGIASDFYTSWRGLDAQMAHVESLVQNSGGVATIETVGTSLEGRDLSVVRFRGPGYSPGGLRMFVTFNMHAREWITGMSGVYAVEQLIAKVQQEPNYLAGMEVVYMPMANPDGFLQSTTNDRMHRKNMEKGSASCPGVDLNRNWDAHWASGGSSGSQCSDTYHGTAAASEPETRVMAQVMNESPMTVYIDVHAYSQLIISAYGWTTAATPRAAEYRVIGGMIQTAIRNAGGNRWTEGPIAQTLYVASGSSVDYADELGALGICFELRPGRFGGGGFAPPASAIVPGAEECHAGLVAAIDYAKSYVPPAPTPAPAPGSWAISGSGCEMDGNCIQSNNHPSNYGNNEQCTINLYGDIPLAFDAFATENRYDFLTVGGAAYSGSNAPPNGAYSGTISWSTDSSVAQSGWKFCRTD